MQHLESSLPSPTVRPSALNSLIMPNPVEEYEEALAKVEELKQKAIDYLNDRRFAITKELAIIDKEIEVMTGAAPRVAGEPKQKYTGKQISFRLLSEMLRERPDRTLSLRKEGYDAKWMRKLVEENPGKLEMGGAGAWPTVTLLAP